LPHLQFVEPLNVLAHAEGVLNAFVVAQRQHPIGCVDGGDRRIHLQDVGFRHRLRLW